MEQLAVAQIDVEAHSFDKIANEPNYGMAMKLLDAGYLPLYWFGERRMVISKGVRLNFRGLEH